MKELARVLGYQEDISYFNREIEKLRENTEKDFFDGEMYRDYSGTQFIMENGEFPYLWRGDNKCGKENLNPIGTPAECNPYSELPCCSEFGWCGNTPGHCSCPKCSKSLPLENRTNVKKKSVFSPHIGYVNLMPFIVGYLSPRTIPFNNTLEMIRSEAILSSDFGLRSLSKSDPLYGSGENYWKGPVWVNFNYLVLRAMKLYYWDTEGIPELYEDLKTKLVSGIERGWAKTGYLWEQYSDSTGKGQRVHPFAGWTTLVLNIIHEIY